MASLGPLYGNNATNVGGITTWGTPANANNDNAAYATCTPSLTAGNNTFLTLQGFDFSAIPSNATITGIVAEIEKKRSGGTTGDLRDQNIALMKVGVVGQNRGATTTNWGTVDAISTYGNSTDLWGTTWTVAEVKAATFGLRIQVTQFGAGSNRIANIDYGRLTVHYTTAGTPETITVDSKSFTQTNVPVNVNEKVLASTKSFVQTMGTATIVQTNAADPKPLPNKILASYFTMWDEPQRRITDADSRYNMVYAFHAEPSPSLTGAFQFNYPASMTQAEVATVRARGQRVILTVGGANAFYDFTTRAKSDAFIASFATLQSNLGPFDGVDFNNFELFSNDTGRYPSIGGNPNPMWTTAGNELAYIAGQLKATYGSNFSISSPINPGYGYAPGDRVIADIMFAAGVLDYIAPQFYDAGSSYNNQSGIYSMAADWIEHVGDASKVVIGFGNGTYGVYHNPPQVDSATTLQESMATFLQLKDAYPTVRGAFSWNMQYDMENEFAFAELMKPLVDIVPAPGPTTVTTATLPSSVVTASGWANPTNIFSSNDARATYTVSGGAETPGMYVSGFTGLSVPAGAVIKGIAVDVEGSITTGTLDYTYAYIVRNGSFTPVRSTSSKSIPFTGTEAVYTLGSTTDDWGGVTVDQGSTKDREWANTDFDSGFQVFLAWAGNATVSVDNVALRVTYQENAGDSGLVTVTTKNFTHEPVPVKVNEKVLVVTKSFTMTRVDATIVQGAGASQIIAVGSKSFAVTMGAATLNEKVLVVTKSFTQTQVPAFVNEKVLVQTKSFAVTMGTAEVVQGAGAAQIIAVDSKSFVQTMGTATVNEKVLVQTKSISMTSVPAFVNEKVLVQTKSFAQTSVAVTLNEKVLVVTKSFAVTMGSATLNEKVLVVTKSFSMAPVNAFVNEKVLVVTKSFSMSGNAQLNEKVLVETLEFTTSTSAIRINAETIIEVETQSYVMTSVELNVNARDSVVVETKSFAVTMGNAQANEAINVQPKSFAMNLLNAQVNEKVLIAPHFFVQTNNVVKVNESVILSALQFTQTMGSAKTVDTTRVETLSFNGVPVELKVNESIKIVGPLAFVQTTYEAKVNESIPVDGYSSILEFIDARLVEITRVETLGFVQTNNDVEVQIFYSPIFTAVVSWTEIVKGPDGTGAMLKRNSQSGTFRVRERLMYTLQPIPVVRGTIETSEIPLVAEV